MLDISGMLVFGLVLGLPRMLAGVLVLVGAPFIAGATTSGSCQLRPLAAYRLGSYFIFFPFRV